MGLVEKIVDSDRNKIKILESKIELLEAQIRERDASRYLMPTQRKVVERKDCWLRVIFGDTHGARVDSDAFLAFAADLEFLSSRVKEIVGLGDHVDCGGLLAESYTDHYVTDCTYTYADDIAAANQHLDMIQDCVPECDFYYIEGNHEHRVEIYAVTHSLRRQTDAKWLLERIGVPQNLYLVKRGIKYVHSLEKTDDTPAGGIIKLGKCYFVHKTSRARNATSAAISKYNCNIVFGDTHRAEHSVKRTMSGVFGAYNPGCLCELQPTWMNTDPTTWTHGYAIQVCHADGSFLHVNVPIVDGQSLLRGLFDE